MAVQKRDLEFRVSHFDRLAGTDRVRLALLAGESVESITGPWRAQVSAFMARRQPYLLYQ
jgi:uncharacterized protein YbbC (DUF1343 family)